MLTSADAKWKCMWYLLVWSILLTLVSLFLQVQNHLAFYIFAAASVILLPFFTAIYSNTAGKHGAGLLRAGLVFFDPVLSCLTLTPVLLLNHLPLIVEQYRCVEASKTLNQTLNCTGNGTQIQMFGKRAKKDTSIAFDKEQILRVKKEEFLVIQASLVVPILLVLLMGRRSRKMAFNTYLLVFAYWFIIAVEAGSLLETLLMHEVYKHVIFTSETVTCIAMIGGNTYAIVTLLSYVNPSGILDNKHSGARSKFTFVYIGFMCVLGILFAEIPMFVTRLQVLALKILLPGSFYLWFIKDFIFILLILVLAYMQRFGQKNLRIPCRPSFDNKHFFQPEKRDEYISQHRQAMNNKAQIKCSLSDSSDSDDEIMLKSKSTKRRKSSAGNNFVKSESVPNISVESSQVETVYVASQRSSSTSNLHCVTDDGAKFKSSDHKKSTALRHSNGVKKPMTKTTAKPKKAKGVSFKLEIGRGHFFILKARSDSPPIYRDLAASPV